MIHIQAKRDEETLRVANLMPLSREDKLILNSHKGPVIVPDPMLASGASNAFTFDLLHSFEIPNNLITLLSIIAAPEGIFRLFTKYPGIKIIASILDLFLNDRAYIYPGLGDAGDKYF